MGSLQKCHSTGTLPSCKEKPVTLEDSMFLRGSTDHNNVRESLPIVPEYSEKNKTDLWKSQLNSVVRFQLEGSGTLCNLRQSSDIITPTDVSNLSKN